MEETGIFILPETEIAHIVKGYQSDNSIIYNTQNIFHVSIYQFVVVFAKADDSFTLKSIGRKTSTDFITPVFVLCQVSDSNVGLDTPFSPHYFRETLNLRGLFPLRSFFSYCSQLILFFQQRAISTGSRRSTMFEKNP
jgi:hypothetical protein